MVDDVLSDHGQEMLVVSALPAGSVVVLALWSHFYDCWTPLLVVRDPAKLVGVVRQLSYVSVIKSLVVVSQDDDDAIAEALAAQGQPPQPFGILEGVADRGDALEFERYMAESFP